VTLRSNPDLLCLGETKRVEIEIRTSEVSSALYPINFRTLLSLSHAIWTVLVPCGFVRWVRSVRDRMTVRIRSSSSVNLYLGLGLRLRLDCGFWFQLLPSFLQHPYTHTSLIHAVSYGCICSSPFLVVRSVGDGMTVCNEPSLSVTCTWD
jgi:hypothetical protein